MNPVIRVDQVSYRFSSGNVVEGLDLLINPGQLFGFVGPNGAGKTTMIKMLLGLLTPREGSIEIFGQTFHKNKKNILRKIGALVEAPAIYPHLTAMENLQIQKLFYSVSDKKCRAVLELTGLVDTDKKVVRQFSLGMKQRLGIAMALLNDPEILILDEPINGLDPVGIKEFRKLLHQLHDEKGITVFLSSHLLAELEQTVDVVAIINKGKMLYQGNLDILKKKNRGMLKIKTGSAPKAGEILQNSNRTVTLTSANSLTVQVADEDDIARINSQLVQAGLDIYELFFEQPNLENIFLEMIARDDQGRA